AAAPEKNLVGAALEILGFEIFGKTRRHRAADAGADKDIEPHSALAKRLVDADMRRAKTAAAGGDESDRAAGEKADQAVDIELILERDVVVHEGRQPLEPRRGAADLAAAPVMNAHAASRRSRMN